MKMAPCACGSASGATHVFLNPGLRRSTKTPLSGAPPYQISSLAFPRASLIREVLPSGVRGGPAPLLSPVSTSPRRANHYSLSLARPLFLTTDNCSFASAFLPFCGGPRQPIRSSIPPRAASREASSYVGNEKPQWWWRTAACLPYFLPLHETWNYGETAYFLQPYLERFEFLTNPVLEVPTWFSMLYFFVAYLWLVRRKELPHFVRFHIMMGMLLENAIQIIWTVSRWMPLVIFGVKIGVYFWTAVSFTLFFCILLCMCCALAGKYADIPYISDAAYVQIPRS